MTRPSCSRCLQLPDHWTPEQALAVFEMLDLMRDRLWLLYAADIQHAMRDDQQRVNPQQLPIPLEPDQPF